jgi:hypothetical protein
MSSFNISRSEEQLEVHWAPVQVLQVCRYVVHTSWLACSLNVLTRMKQLLDQTGWPHASTSSKSLYSMDGLHFAELVFAFLDGNSCVPWWVLLSSYHLIIMYLQIVFGLVCDERYMIGSKWHDHQLAIGDSTHSVQYPPYVVFLH